MDTTALDQGIPTTYDIPTSVVHSSREELTDVPLQVRKFEIDQQGQLQAIASDPVTLPTDLTGYYLVAAALSPPAIQVINGDGMVYRVEFAGGQATLKTRLAKPPCYYADQITQRSPEYPQPYRFENAGPSRASFRLGNRNQLNTAFLQTRDRLLLTFDAGIPWVLDPESLEIIEPVGRMDQWLAITVPFSRLVPALQNQIFPTHSNPAHPVCDRYQPEKDFPSVPNLSMEAIPPDHFLTLNYSTGYKGKFKKAVNRFLAWVLRRVPGMGQGKNLAGAQRVYGFTDLIRYTFGDRKLERWQLVLPDWNANKPDVKKLLIGEQAIHQMVITQDYIILVDMAFKIEFSQIFSPFLVKRIENLLDILLKWMESLTQEKVSKEKLLRWRLEQGYKLYSFFLKLLPPSQITNFYIISRSELQNSDNNPGGTITDLPKSIRVRQVTIPREVSHFTADYCNPDGKITFHVGHQNNTDVTEWISQYDKLLNRKDQTWDDQSSHCKRLAGMTTGAMDVSSLGRYIVDGETGALLDSQVMSDVHLTWWPSVYTHRDICRDRPEAQDLQVIKNLYWMCWGFSWELIPKRIYQAYKNRDFRVIHYTELPVTGKPCTLLRLDTQTMQIADWFTFPQGYFACSPQFIPKSTPCPAGQDPSTHGYIACIVLADTRDRTAGTMDATPDDEIWIFEASNLGNAQNPQADTPSPVVYRLSQPTSLDLGLTIHSVWLSPDDFERNAQAYRDPEVRKALRRAAFWRDHGAFVSGKTPASAEQEKPRSAGSVHAMTQKLFQEIEAAFIDQKPFG